MTLAFHEIIVGSFLHGNSLQIPQNCTPCSLAQACTLHLPDSAHSGTRPSASIHPGHEPSIFLEHPTQHSPQAVIVVKSVMSFPPNSMKTWLLLSNSTLAISSKKDSVIDVFISLGYPHGELPRSQRCLPVKHSRVK